MSFPFGRCVISAVMLASFVAAASAATSVRAALPATASYTPAQAAKGASVYATSCAQCHGTNLEGGVGPALTGANLKTLSKNTKLTIGDMFTFMSQQMPMNAPASLKTEQYAAIMAFILKKNGYPAGSAPLRYATALDSKITLTSKN